MKPRYTYRAVAARTVDGDTVELEIDLGFDIAHSITVRLAGIDAPEKRTVKTRPAALATQARLAQLIERALGTKTLVVSTEKGDPKEKFGRYLALLFNEGEPASFNDTLVAEGLAKPYDGGKRE